MTKKGNAVIKWLVVVLVVLIVLALGLIIWNYFISDVNYATKTIKNTTPIKVAELSTDKEKTFGTIIYPGVAEESITITKNNLADKATFEVTDSLDGVINIYSQDLINRYPDATVTKKEIKKSDARDKKAVTISCITKTDKIYVTAWENTSGRTSVEIENTINIQN